MRAGLTRQSRLPSVSLGPALVFALCALLLVAPQWFGLPGELGPISALVVLAIGFWATGAVPEYLTALIFFTLGTVFALAPPEVLFAGFTASSFWLVVGGLIIGAAFGYSGLGERLGAIAQPHLAGSYPRLIYGTVALCFLAAFLIPAAMARMVIIIPIALRLAERAGLERGRPGYTGVVAAAVLGCFFPSMAVLPAQLLNMLVYGQAEALYGLRYGYLDYLLANVPALGLLKCVLIAELCRRLYPDELAAAAPPPPAPGDADHRLLGMSLVLALALGLWLTDVVHGISPGWVALLAGVLCLLPRLDLLPPEPLRAAVNLAPAFYVAGILGLGATIAHSGLGDTLAQGLLAVVPLAAGGGPLDAAVLVLTYVALSLLVTLAGVPPVMAPLGPQLAAASGLPLETVLLLMVPMFSAALLPYQAAPLIVGMAIGGLDAKRATKLFVLQGALTLLLLLPVHLLWLWLIGWFD